MVNDVARNIPRISAALEHRQVKHQSTMIDIEGTILNQFFYILIDWGNILSYISPQSVEKGKLRSEKFKNA